MKKKKELKEQLKASESLVRDLAILNNKHGARAVEYAAELAQLREQLASVESERDHAQDALEAASERLDKLAATVGELETLSQIAKPSPVDWRAVLCGEVISDGGGRYVSLMEALDSLREQAWCKVYRDTLHARLTEALAQHEAAQAPECPCCATSCCDPSNISMTVTVLPSAPEDCEPCDEARSLAGRIVDRLFRGHDGTFAAYLDMRDGLGSIGATWNRNSATEAVSEVLLESKPINPAPSPDAALIAEVRGLLTKRHNHAYVSLVEGLELIATNCPDYASWSEVHLPRLTAFLARHPEPTAGESEPPKVDDCDTAKALQKITTHAWVVTVTEPKADPLATYNQHYADLKAEAPGPAPWPLNREWGAVGQRPTIEGKWGCKGDGRELRATVRERGNGQLKAKFHGDNAWLALSNIVLSGDQWKWLGPLPSAEGEG